MNGIIAQSAEQRALTPEVASSRLAGPTKKCGRCRIIKSITEFHRRGKKYQGWCKTCKKAYDAERFQRTKVEHRKKTERIQADFRRWAESLKRGPCIDCQQCFPPCCMDWHHRDAATKIATVGELTGTGNKRRVLEEIAKCDLVCA